LGREKHTLRTLISLLHLLPPSPPEIGIPAAQSTAVGTVDAALKAAAVIGYPIILRSAFSLGGLGSGFANNEEELRDLSAKSLSLSPQVLIEKSLKGWKEVEYEVVRDAADVSADLFLRTKDEEGKGRKEGREKGRELIRIGPLFRTPSSAATWRTSTPLEHTLEILSSSLPPRRFRTTSTTCFELRPSRSFDTSESSESESFCAPCFLSSFLPFFEEADSSFFFLF